MAHRAKTLKYSLGEKGRWLSIFLTGLVALNMIGAALMLRAKHGATFFIKAFTGLAALCF